MGMWSRGAAHAVTIRAMARLFVLSGASIGTTFDIDGSVVLGRGDEADVVLREPSVSRKHAQLEPQLEPGVWKVIDLNSSNGLHHGGRRVREVTVRDGDTFTLGEVEIRLRDEADGASWAAAAAHGARPSDEDPSTGHAAAGGLEDGFELEFGDDIDREIAKAPRPVAPAAGPDRRSGSDSGPGSAAGSTAGSGSGQPSAGRAGARATQERAARRAAAVGSIGGQAGGASAGGASGGVVDSGRPVLQYNRKEGKGVDVNQLPGGLRGLIVVIAIAVALGVAYGAFTLTRTARIQTSVLSD